MFVHHYHMFCQHEQKQMTFSVSRSTGRPKRRRPPTAADADGFRDGSRDGSRDGFGWLKLASICAIANAIAVAIAVAMAVGLCCIALVLASVLLLASLLPCFLHCVMPPTAAAFALAN